MGQAAYEGPESNMSDVGILGAGIGCFLYGGVVAGPSLLPLALGRRRGVGDPEGVRAAGGRPSLEEQWREAGGERSVAQLSVEPGFLDLHLTGVCRSSSVLCLYP